MALRKLLLVKEVMMVKQAMFENVKRLSKTINRFRERIESFESNVLNMLEIFFIGNWQKPQAKPGSSQAPGSVVPISFKTTSTNLIRIDTNVAKAGGLQSQGVKGEVVVVYLESLTTQDLKSSGFPEG